MIIGKNSGLGLLKQGLKNLKTTNLRDKVLLHASKPKRLKNVTVEYESFKTYDVKNGKFGMRKIVKPKGKDYYYETTWIPSKKDSYIRETSLKRYNEHFLATNPLFYIPTGTGKYKPIGFIESNGKNLIAANGEDIVMEKPNSTMIRLLHLCRDIPVRLK